MSGRKLAIVMSGGGTRSAYGAGALVAMAEEFGVTRPECMVAESGSALTAIYYLARQYARLVAGWLNVPDTPEFISRTSFPLINIDVLKEELRKEFPIDTIALATATTDLFIPLTRVSDGAVIYHRLSSEDNPYELLHAAMALPIFYGKRVRIRDEWYIDGGFGAHLDDHVRYALRGEPTHLIIVQCSGGPGAFTRRLYRTAGLAWRLRGFVGLALAAAHEIAPPRQLTIPAEVKALRVKPSRRLPVSVGTKSKRKLRRAFDMGYADALRNRALRELLKDYVDASVRDSVKT